MDDIAPYVPASGPHKTYRGNCHCAAFVYEVSMPEDNEVQVCNCSICVRKGYMMVCPSREDFKVIKGSVDALARYTFRSGIVEHKYTQYLFCKICGIAVVGLGHGVPKGYEFGINARTFQDFEGWQMKQRAVNGKNLGDPYDPPAHKGPLPQVEPEGGIPTIGSCHCGRVTVAVHSKPLDETYDGQIFECNCSICERGAYISMYLKNEQVVLHAEDPEDISSYSFGRGIIEKTFCRHCGVHMTNKYRPPTEEWLANASGFDKQWLPMAKANHNVNVKVLHDMDLSKLDIARSTVAKALPPFYLNP